MYYLLKDGDVVQSRKKGEYAGYVKGKIFGRLDCKRGMLMKKESRVFFGTLEDAVREGYRPCNVCKPIDEEDFERIKHLVPEETLEDFYRRKIR